MVQLSPEEMASMETDRNYNLHGSQRMDVNQIRVILDDKEILDRFSADMQRKNIDNQGNLVEIMQHWQEVVATTKEDENAILTKEGQYVKIINKKAPLQPLMNELGIKDMKSYLWAYLNKNMKLGEYDEFQIAQMVKETMWEISGTIFSNYQMYGIEPQNKKMITSIMFSYIFEAATMAKGGNTAVLLTKTQQSIEHTINKLDSPEQEKKGFLGGFLRR